jgi:hypothetical protein
MVEVMMTAGEYALAVNDPGRPAGCRLPAALGAWLLNFT